MFHGIVNPLKLSKSDRSEVEIIRTSEVRVAGSIPADRTNLILSTVVPKKPIDCSDDEVLKLDELLKLAEALHWEEMELLRDWIMRDRVSKFGLMDK
jgi:hypothetical protein